MRRILVIGCSGAGKSTLSRCLAERLQLPVYHLDRLFWLPGWQQRESEEFLEEQETLLREPAWIIDGNYGSSLHLRLAACDTVVYLDLPLRTCFAGVLRRRFTRAPRPDMTEGCPERFDWEYYRFVFNYRRQHRPRTERLLAQVRHCTIHRLRSRREVREFLATVAPITNNFTP